jgi:hypothetical protein
MMGYLPPMIAPPSYPTSYESGSETDFYSGVSWLQFSAFETCISVTLSIPLFLAELK